MATIDDIMNQIGNEPTPTGQIRRLAEIVSEAVDAMNATTSQLETKAAQLHNHEAALASPQTVGHVKPGAGFELLSDGTINVAPTLEGLVRRPLSVTPMPGAVPLAGPDGTLSGWIPDSAGILVGSPVYLPGPVLPSGFLWPDRSLVLFADWPELHAAYTAGYLSVQNSNDGNYPGRWVRNDATNPTGLYLPSLGGAFLRPWRPGQSWDTGRPDGHVQGDAIRNMTGTATSIRTIQNPWYTGVLYQTSGANVVNGSGASNPSWSVNFNAARQVPTANENRPVNIAWPLAIYLGKPAKHQESAA